MADLMVFLVNHKYYLVNAASSLTLLGLWFFLYRSDRLNTIAARLESLAQRAAIKRVVFALTPIMLLIAQGASLPVLGGDSAGYFQAAADFANGQGISTVPWSRGPGIALLYGPLFLLFGQDSTLAFQILNGVFTIGAIWLIHPLALRLRLPEDLALGGIVIGSFSLSFVCRSVTLMTEIPASFFSMLALFGLVELCAAFRLRYFVLLMAALTELILLRPENTVLGGLSLTIAAFIGWNARKRLMNAKSIAVLLLTALVAGMTLSFVMADRYQRFGSWDLKGGNGVVLFSGIVTFASRRGHDFLAQDNPDLQHIWQTVTKSDSPYANPQWIKLDESEPDPMFLSYAMITGTSFAETDRLFARAALRAWRQEPVALTWMLIWKGYTYIFQDVKVRTITGLKAQDELLSQAHEAFTTGQGRRYYVSNYMMVTDNPDTLLFGHIRMGPPPSELAVDILRKAHALLQAWNAYTGLFWNHLALGGLLILAWRSRSNMVYAVIFLFAFFKLPMPIMFGLGDQRFYLPGLPLLILSLLAMLDAVISAKRLARGDAGP